MITAYGKNRHQFVKTPRRREFNQEWRCIFCQVPDDVPAATLECPKAPPRPIFGNELPPKNTPA